MPCNALRAKSERFMLLPLQGYVILFYRLLRNASSLVAPVRWGDAPTGAG